MEAYNGGLGGFASSEVLGRPGEEPPVRGQGRRTETRETVGPPMCAYFVYSV